jgi:hypothetical protein
MPHLVIFSSKDYADDQEGFKQALANNDVRKVDVDSTKGSFNFMHKVSAEIEKMVEVTGDSVCFGLCTEENTYVPISDLSRIETSSSCESEQSFFVFLGGLLCMCVTLFYAMELGIIK